MEHADVKADDRNDETSTTADTGSEFIVRKEGLFWPKSDQICFDAIKNDLPFLDKAVSFCKKRTRCRTVIQAGGNAGMYPVHLAKKFKRVYTFEPEFLNYQCLDLNVMKVKNVVAKMAALGDSHSPVALTGWEPNCGAYEIAGRGTIEQVRIDDLDLDEVDFIQLDIQGYELHALKGAIETLNRYSPVLMIEEGWGTSATGFLLEMGYSAVESSSNKGRVRDTIYAKA